MKALKKLNRIEKNLEMSFLQVQNSKGKMDGIKSHLLRSSARFLLNKQKLKNMLNIHGIVKNKLQKWLSVFSQSKSLRQNKQYSLLYQNMLSLQEDINNSKSFFKNRSLTIIDIFIKKSKVKLEKLKHLVEEERNTMFIDKKDNYLELFSYYLSENKGAQHDYDQVVR